MLTVPLRAAQGTFSRDSHFLRELIQNADDNDYSEDVIPALSFTLQKDSLRIDCNELGFTENHVRALCCIGESTKRAENVRSYIGEKGIGFKAVFMAADKVFVHSKDPITSEYYSFMFNDALKETEYTKLLPTWANFPSDVIEGQTQFLLHLRPGILNELIEHLTSMEPTILLFLQSLQRIHIDLPRKIRINLTCNDSEESTRTILKKEVIRPQGEITSSAIEYIKFQTTVKKLPNEARREGVVESPSVLAFPLRNGSPYISKQHAYAFLPIKDFGFQV